MKATKPDGIQALLDSATKSTTRKSKHLKLWDQQVVELAKSFASYSKMNDEMQRDLAKLKEDIIREATPEHERYCRNQGAHEPTVEIDAGNHGTVRISFQHRYGKISADKAPALVELLGDEYQIPAEARQLQVFSITQTLRNSLQIWQFR